MKSTLIACVLVIVFLAGCDSSTPQQPPAGNPQGSPQASDETPQPTDETTQPADETPQPAEAPTLISDDFSSNAGTWKVTLDDPGSIVFGLVDPEASDFVRIQLEGHPELSSSDYPGAGRSNEIRSLRTFSFGKFLARVRAARCSSNDEEVLSGIFLYGNDGASDRNENGIIDNNEIDVEIACTEPHAIYLTSWTDYTDDGHFLKVSRKVDLMTGNAYQTIPGREGQYGLSHTPVENLPEILLPDLSLVDSFFEVGWEWAAANLRFFLVTESGEEVTLWNFQDDRFIPQEPVPFYFNVWHSTSHWNRSGAADYPHQDASLDVDRLDYLSQ